MFFLVCGGCAVAAVAAVVCFIVFFFKLMRVVGLVGLAAVAARLSRPRAVAAAGAQTIIDQLKIVTATATVTVMMTQG